MECLAGGRHKGHWQTRSKPFFPKPAAPASELVYSLRQPNRANATVVSENANRCMQCIIYQCMTEPLCELREKSPQQTFIGSALTWATACVASIFFIFLSQSMGGNLPCTSPPLGQVRLACAAPASARPLAACRFQFRAICELPQL